MSLIGGLSDLISGGNQSKAAGASQASVDALNSLQTPDVTKMQLQLETLVQQGQITPEEAELYLQQESAMNDIELDPALKQAQMDALSSLQDISSSGGMTAMDKALLGQIQTQEQTASRGAREAIIQNAQARGLGGSGIELMQQMQNQQDSATRQSQRDLDVAGMAQSRALEALQAAGNLGGQIGQQQFGQQAQVASANDAISRFNTQNSQDVSNLNTANRNATQAANLAEKQRIADANAATRNQQQEYNKQLAQQDFENRYKKAGGVANAYQAQTQQFNNAGAANKQLVGTLIGAGATAASGVEAAKGKANGGIIEGPDSDVDNMMTPTMSGEFVVRKDDVPEFLKKAHTDEDGEFDAAAFLDSITGHQYGYSKKGKK